MGLSNSALRCAPCPAPEPQHAQICMYRVPTACCCVFGEAGPAFDTCCECCPVDSAAVCCRCLAFATKSLAGTIFADYDGSTTHNAHKALQDVSQYSNIESGLTLVGLAGLQDPPRPEVKGAITDCGLAGVRVIVITGVWVSCTTHLPAVPAMHRVENYRLPSSRTREVKVCATVKRSSGMQSIWRACAFGAVSFRCKPWCIISRGLHPMSYCVSSLYSLHASPSLAHMQARVTT